MNGVIEGHAKRVKPDIYRLISGMVWIVPYGVAMLAMMMGGYWEVCAGPMNSSNRVGRKKDIPGPGAQDILKFDTVVSR